MSMKQQNKKTRKNIMVNLDLVKRAKKVFNASSDSQAIEMALKQAGQKKTDEELWEATQNIVKLMAKHKIKPLVN